MENIKKMTYNMTWMNGTTGIDTLIENVNGVAGGWLISIILLVVFVVLVASYSYKYSIGKVMFFSSFVMMVLALLLFSVGWIPGSHLAIFGALLFFSIMATIFFGGGD